MSEDISSGRLEWVCKVVCSWDFWAAGFLTALLLLRSYDTLVGAYQPVLDTFIVISITLVTIILAGFAIIVSYGDPDFVVFLQDAGVYKNTIIHFEIPIFVAILTLLLGLYIRFISTGKILFASVLFLFLYSILSVANLVHFIGALGMKRGEFLSLTKKS